MNNIELKTSRNMKNLFFYSILLLIMSAHNSCNKRGQLIGIWDDEIKLSQKNVNFDSNANSVTISTESANWWIHTISLDKNSLDITGVNTLEHNFVFTSPEIQVERKDGKKLIIIVSPNFSNKERVFNIGLQDGNYSDGITITQSK